MKELKPDMTVSEAADIINEGHVWDEYFDKFVRMAGRVDD
jgi:hypothetical protein